MKKFELWTHTLTNTIATFVVLPMTSYEILENDHVQAEITDHDYIEIEDLQVISNNKTSRHQGRGTVLIDAVAKFAKEKKRKEITGHLVTEEGIYGYMEEWYHHHGIGIENGYLVGKVDTILSMCAQIMHRYDLLYDLVDKPRYELK